MYKNAICVSSKEDFLAASHWVILIFRSVNIPGDERSRTNPGQGYPVRSESTVKYMAYPNKKDWEAEILGMEIEGNKNYVAFKATGAATVKIETQVKVSYL